MLRMTVEEFEARLKRLGVCDIRKHKIEPTPAKPKAQRKRPVAVDLLIGQIEAYKLPAPVPEVRFDAVRKWRFDLAWPDLKIAAEVDGGIWTQGRHTRGAGYEGDMEKFNAATLKGWQVYRFSTEHVTAGYAIDILRAALTTKP